MAIDARFGIPNTGMESASTGLLTSLPGNSYSSSGWGLLCAQLDRDVDIVPVICRDKGDDTVEWAPTVLVPPLYIPSTFDEGTADKGEGHHVPPIVAVPCDNGEGQYVWGPCGRSSCGG